MRLEPPAAAFRKEKQLSLSTPEFSGVRCKGYTAQLMQIVPVPTKLEVNKCYLWSAGAQMHNRLSVLC